MNVYDRYVLPYQTGPRPMTFHDWGQAQAA
jgi:hypothetical protein